MAAHEIGHQILLQAVALVQPPVFLPEPLVHLKMRLAHVVQHLRGAVFRSHLQLSGDVVSDQLGQKLTVLLTQQVVEPDAAADKHLLYPRHRPDLPQQGQIVGVTGVQIFAGGGGQTGAVFAQAVFLLLLAGGMPEVGRRPAYVVDVALEFGVPGKPLHLPDHALVTAGGNHPSLMEGQRAEAAPAEAAPVVGDGEPDLLNGGHAAPAVIHGVDLPGIGQLRYRVQLLPAQRHGGGIHHQRPVPVAL